MDNFSDILATFSQECYFVKGAVDRILRRCTLAWSGPDLPPRSLTTGLEEKFLLDASSLGRQGLRVVGLAEGTDPHNLIFCGMVGIVDPPREGVDAAVATLQVKITMHGCRNAVPEEC